MFLLSLQGRVSRVKVPAVHSEQPLNDTKGNVKPMHREKIRRPTLIIDGIFALGAMTVPTLDWP